MPHFCTRAAADPTPLGGGLAGGAHGLTYSVADYVGRVAIRLGRGIPGIGKEAVRANERGGIIVDARRVLYSG
jgi:hypothetical protein